MTTEATPNDPLVAGYLASRDEPCPRCGYNLRGVAGGACPECGRELLLELAGRERWDRFARPAWVVLGLILLVNAGTLLTYGVWIIAELFWSPGFARAWPSSFLLAAVLNAGIGLTCVAIGAVLATRVRRERRTEPAMAAEVLIRGTLRLTALYLAAGIATWMIRFFIR